MKQEPQITPVDAGLGITFQIDAREQWEVFRDENFQTQLERIGYNYHFSYYWLVQLPWMEMDYEIKSKFWDAYQTESAVKSRKNAIHGLCWTNYEAERDFLNMAMDSIDIFDECAREKKTLGETYSTLGPTDSYLGSFLRKKLAAQDYQSFERMAAIIKHGGTPQSDKQRGGQESIAGTMFREFCQYHLRTRSLPTKKELREACGYGGTNSEIRAAGKIMKLLGLDGLPEARDLPSKK